MNLRPKLAVLARLAVILLGAVVMAGATTFPATAEVDLVFPRNDTYAPSALFPIVFAFQNPELAPSLDPLIILSLWNASNHSALSYSGVVDTTFTNFSGSGPTYVWTDFKHLNVSSDGTSSSWWLQWVLESTNCSVQGKVDGQLGDRDFARDGSVFFTIQNGAQAADLVAPTASTAPSCSDMSHFAFNLTGTLDTAGPFNGAPANRNTCAIFSDVQPIVAGNPCAALVGSATASSILAALTSADCTSATPAVSCPPSTTASPNAAPGGRDTGYTGYKAGLGRIWGALVAMYAFVM